VSEARITGTTEPEEEVKAAPAPATETPKAAPQAAPAEEKVEAEAPGVVELTEPLNEPKEPAWVQRRINKAVAEREEARRRVQELEILLAAHPAAAAPDGEEGKSAKAPAKALSPAELNAQVEQRAAQLHYQREVEKVYQEGLKTYPMFAQAVQDLNTKASMTDFVIETVMDFDDPAKVFMGLSQDLDESSRIFAIPNARKQVQELTKFALQLEAPRPKSKVTKAPDPIEPKIGGPTKTEVNLDADNVSSRDWIAERQRQVDARRKAGDKRIR